MYMKENDDDDENDPLSWT